MQVIPLAPDKQFLRNAAQHVLQLAAEQGLHGDLSACQIIVPNLLMVPALSAALADAAGQALLLPRMDTLAGTVEPWLRAVPHWSDARRHLVLHGQLRRQAWFDEAGLWDVVAELTRLFDELSDNAAALPDDESVFLAQLAQAYALRASEPLSFEARVAHSLWRAEAEGLPSRAAARQIAASRWINARSGPVVFVAEGPSSPAQQALLAAIDRARPLWVLRADRGQARGPLADALAAAWPLAAQHAQALRDRALSLDPQACQAGLERVELVAADGLESLAFDASQRVVALLQSGVRNIALIAVDRLAARRTRALLERQGVLVADETGWKMATTRAAANVDGLLEVFVSDGWHRAIVDVLDAPFLFADVALENKRRAAHVIVRAQVQLNILKGFEALRKALSGEGLASELVERLLAARRAMSLTREASVAQWLTRLLESLEIVGARQAMAQDAAGAAWLEWLEARRAELAEDEQRLSFSLWRSWFNRQMDSEMFRDRSISSPVLITHLAATRLRSFEAAIVLGADAAQLQAPRQQGMLAHAGVRRELGLPGLEQAQAQMREDLAGLLLACDIVVLAWQAHNKDEAVLPAPEVVLWRELLQAPVRHAQAFAVEGGASSPRQMPRPAMGLNIERLSASGLQALLQCPYRYFARYDLRLGESDELAEELDKRDYGERFHALLAAFHRQFPRLTGQDPDLLRAAFQACCAAQFDAAISRNYLDHAWRISAQSRADDYIAWQCEREAQGWHFMATESDYERALALSDGGALVLLGRVDRVDDNHGAEALAVLDYKTRKKDALKKQIEDPDDVQLAFYGLLVGGDVSEAAYVSLDDEQVSSIALPDPAGAADVLARRIDEVFVAMRRGEGMPAHGAESACRYCEMRGLCRKDWFS